MKNKRGATLVELLVVIAIVVLLAVIAVPSFIGLISKAKRTEAYMNLGALYIAQKAYHAEHGCYASSLGGQKGLGWIPEGYRGGGQKEAFRYTYGFSSGGEGTHYVTGNLEAPASALGATHATKDSFIMGAVADIDGDGQYDLLTVNEFHEIKIVHDDTVALHH